MTASIIVVNGLLKVFRVMAYTNRKKKVCRIYDGKDDTIPEKLLEESEPGSNLFEDKILGKRYLHTQKGMVSL